MKKLKEVLKKKRFELNVTQNQAAVMMGVTPYYYNKLENGKIANPRPSTVKKISKFSGVDESKVRDML